VASSRFSVLGSQFSVLSSQKSKPYGPGLSKFLGGIGLAGRLGVVLLRTGKGELRFDFHI
jgi:hypothetical protein